MASVSVIAPQVMNAGEYVDGAIQTTDKEQYTFRFTSTAGSSGDETQARMWVTSPGEGNIRLGDILINGSQSRQLRFDKVPATIRVHVEVRQGVSTVSVTRETALDAVDIDDTEVEAADLADGAVTTAKLATGALSADATGLTKMADGFLAASAGARAKMADGFLSADATGRAKMADGFIQNAKLAAGTMQTTKLATTGIKVLRFDGVGAAGPCTLTGAVIGDRVLFILGTTVATGVSVVGGTDFESVITVDDEIQQSLAGDLTGNDYWVVLIPAAA